MRLACESKSLNEHKRSYEYIDATPERRKQEDSANQSPPERKKIVASRRQNIEEKVLSPSVLADTKTPDFENIEMPTIKMVTFSVPRLVQSRRRGAHFDTFPIQKKHLLSVDSGASERFAYKDTLEKLEKTPLSQFDNTLLLSKVEKDMTSFEIPLAEIIPSSVSTQDLPEKFLGKKLKFIARASEPHKYIRCPKKSHKQDTSDAFWNDYLSPSKRKKL